MPSRGSFPWIRTKTRFKFRLFLAISLPFTGAATVAAAAPGFTITASNVTLPSGSSTANSNLMLTAASGYSGSVIVNCAYAGSSMGARPPNCGGGALRMYQLTSGQTKNGIMPFYPYGKVIPFAHSLTRGWGRTREPVLGLALIGACILGVGRRRKAACWLALLVLSAAALTGIAACGGNGTSGTFPFTLTAVDTRTNASASTNIMVTVP